KLSQPEQLPEPGPGGSDKDVGIHKPVRPRRVSGAGGAAAEWQSARRVPVRSQFCMRCAPGAPMNIIAFFNNTGGVGKTTLVYHLAWMFSERGLSVVAADM